jgi:hypothetical protein
MAWQGRRNGPVAPTLDVLLLEAVMRPDHGGCNQNRDQDDEADGPGPAFESCPDRLSRLGHELFKRLYHLPILIECYD